MPEIDKYKNNLSITIQKRITNNKIVITPKKPKYTLKELLAGVSSKDFNGEYEWGEPLGKGVW